MQGRKTPRSPQMDLLPQLSAATDPDDKKAIQALIDKITGRL